MIRPLTKQSLDGQLYTRPPAIQDRLERLAQIAPVERTNQLEAGVDGFGQEIPHEALVHFMREAWRASDKAVFKRIYLALCGRVEQINLKRIPDSRFSGAAGARDLVLQKFIDLVSEDCKGLHDRLDYFEARFNSGLYAMRVSIVRKYKTAADKRIDPFPLLKRNADTGEYEIPPKLEEKATRFAAEKMSRLDDPDFRSALFAAIDKLPRDLKDVLVLSLKKMPVESADPTTMTITRKLNCTARTVLNRYKSGALALRELLKEAGDE